MIYFDNSKQAHGSEIASPLCVVQEADWEEFQTLTLGKDYDVTSDGIVDLRESAEYKAEQALEREKTFYSEFIEIPNFGWYRKTPKGYSSAVESINTAFNAVSVLGSLPADYLIFYEKPDFTKPKECTEEWLIAHQTKNEAMSAEEFGQFYAAFITVWNSQEHLSQGS